MTTSTTPQALIAANTTRINVGVVFFGIVAGIGFGFLLAINPMGDMSRQSWSALMQNLTAFATPTVALLCGLLASRLHRRNYRQRAWFCYGIGGCFIGMMLGSYLSYFVTR